MPAIEVVYTIVVHFIVGGAAVLVAKLGTRWSTSVYRGEWAYCSIIYQLSDIGTDYQIMESEIRSVIYQTLPCTKHIT